MAACGLEKDGRMWKCAACGREYQRGAASASRRRGPRPRRRAPPPVVRACARRRRASARARGRRGSSLLSERGFLASRRRRREAARSRASWRCPEHRLPASIACARQTSWEAALPALRSVGACWAASQAPFKDALRSTRCKSPARHSKPPPIHRRVGVRARVLEHRNDKCDPRATTLTKKGPREEGTRSPQHNSLPLGARGPRPEQRVRRQRLDWRGRHLDALLDSFGRRPPQAPQPLRQH